MITGNLRLADAPGNVFLPARISALPKDSVVNVSEVLTLDRSFLDEQVGKLPDGLIKEVGEGLRLVLDL